MKFTCIDFETANEYPESACSVGVAVFRGGTLENSGERLLLPPAAYRFFRYTNISIHGIHAADVKDSPEFPDIADWLFQCMEDGVVLAHNAAFDMNVLKTLCDHYGIRYPGITYLCTCKLSRRLWKNVENHKLNTLCDYIGFSFRHHNAEADAEAAGRVMYAMLREADCESPLELAEKLRIRPGILSTGEVAPCTALSLSRSKKVKTGEHTKEAVSC